MLREQSRIYNMDCIDGMKDLQRMYGRFVDCVVTSPPYAEQRKNQYGGIRESDYPLWTLNWMNVLEPLLADDASVFIVIRPHIKNGVISDYVLKTRLLLREYGWNECEEMIWIKPDAPALGSIERPRRSWEHILWFSRSNKPYCNTKANGQVSNRIGFENEKFEHGGASHIHAGQNRSSLGISRSRDYVECGTGKVEKGIKHPAIYPLEIPRWLINMATKENGMVLDPFMGSGTTARAAIELGRGFVGFELVPDYYDGAMQLIRNKIAETKTEKLYPEFLELFV